MASLSAIQTLWAPTPRACSQCLRRHVPSSAWLAQRRYLRRSHGPKYTAKLEAADAEWKERAEKIRSGQQPDLWDTFVVCGYVKDVVGYGQPSLEPSFFVYLSTITTGAC